MRILDHAGVQRYRAQVNSEGAQTATKDRQNKNKTNWNITTFGTVKPSAQYIIIRNTFSTMSDSIVRSIKIVCPKNVSTSVQITLSFKLHGVHMSRE